MITIDSLKKLRSNENFRGFEGIDGPTPVWLCQNMINLTPVDYKDPNKKWLFPASGHGTYAIVVYWKYMKGLSEVIINDVERSRHILYNMLYLNEINPYLSRQLRKLGFINVIEGDYVNYDFKMKFDVVIGNPPFTKDVGGGNVKPLWNEFIKKSFDFCEENGYVCLIHPNGWRNIQGSFKDIQILMKSKEIKYLELHSVNDGKNTFGVTTPYDICITKNCKNKQDEVEIVDYDGIKGIFNIKNMEYIPNSNFEIINRLTCKNNEECVEVIEDSSYHHQRDYVSSISDEYFKYPCVYSIYKNGDFSLKYSKINNKGHFGIPKLILGNGANPTCFLDVDGYYGMTQFVFGIIDTLENLNKIKLVIESEFFSKITKSTKYVATEGNPLVYPKILRTFRKDFWKEFIDEDGNIIEPKPAINVE